MNNLTDNIDTYDRDRNFYYKSISDKIREDKEKKSIFSKKRPSSITITNLAIINTEESSHKLLFEEGSDVDIRFIQFELAHNGEKKKIEFEDEHLYVRNNVNIEKRAIKDRLLIGVNVQGAIELWIAKKDGSSLERLVTVDKEEVWHLDVKNSKIRVISSIENSFSMQSFEW